MNTYKKYYAINQFFVCVLGFSHFCGWLWCKSFLAATGTTNNSSSKNNNKGAHQGKEYIYRLDLLELFIAIYKYSSASCAHE